MGKLKDLRAEYISCPKDTPREREIIEAIKNIVESEWWDKNVGKPFNWPKKGFKWKRFGFELDQFCYFGNFIIPIDEKDLYIQILTQNTDA